jgi:hypothetical protein
MRFQLTQLLQAVAVFPIAVSGVVMAQSTFDLGKPLEVRLTQAGIAGESGTQWLIEPTGKWTAQHIESGAPVVTYATGNLKPNEVGALRQILTSSDVGALPSTLGLSGRANPQKLTIRWGDHASTLVRPGGESLSDSDDNAKLSPQLPEERMVSIARQVRKLTTD